MVVPDTTREAAILAIPEVSDACLVPDGGTGPESTGPENTGPESAGDGRLAVLVVRQGFVYGPELRDLVLAALGRDEGVDVVLVERIERDADGVVDAQEAARQIAESPWRYRFEPPRSDVERDVAEIVRDLLKVDRVSMTDGLTDLGGDSLAAVELADVVHERFGVEIDSRDLFQVPSLTALAGLVRRA